MIDFKITEVGRAEAVQRFKDAEGALRVALRDEMAAIGEEIVSRAQSLAPRASGLMARQITWGFGQLRARGRGDQRKTRIVETRGEAGNKIVMTAMPRGRVAHLVERGVSASFYQSPGNRGRGKLFQPKDALKAVEGPRFLYARTLVIAPRPFFMPAVESVGGAVGVGARLQGVVSATAGGA